MKKTVGMLAVAWVVLVSGTVGAQPPQFDIVLTGGWIIDGTGNPAFMADVGIRDGRIAAVGQLSGAAAARRLDLGGKTILPGFIDLHSHSDDAFEEDENLSNRELRRAAPNLVMQGITTLVMNQDGRSPWPIAQQKKRIEQGGVGPNVILMVGHGTVRQLVMKDDFRRVATQDEITAMRQLVNQGLDEGAWGLSAGLEYVPGRWSETSEVVALVEEVSRRHGVYISHERSEGTDPMWFWPSRDPAGPPTLIDAVLETIEIGEKTGATVVATHLKAKGAHYWGSSRAVIQLIEAARKRGVRIWGDHYPYETSGSDGNTVLIPNWAWAQERNGDHAARLKDVLSDAKTAAALRQDISYEIRRRGGADRVVVFEYPDSSVVGKSLDEVARAWGVEPVEAAIRLQMEGDKNRPGGGRLRGFSLNEMDIQAYAAQEWVATASDAGIALPEDGSVHARYYGTFPRKIRRYAMELGVISVEDAVRSMTSLPAIILGLRDRGLVREGFHADLVIVDLEKLADRATFFEPHQYPDGIEAVWVNGTPIVEGGSLTTSRPGRVLTP